LDLLILEMAGSLKKAYAHLANFEDQALLLVRCNRSSK